MSSGADEVEGWAVTRVGDAFEVQLGKMLSPEASIGKNLKPYLANRNVQWNRLELDDLGLMSFASSERDRFRLKRGDLLVCEGGEIGRTAIWSDEITECYFQKAIHRLRPLGKVIEPRFLLHYMEHVVSRSALANFVSQTSIAHLTRENLVKLPIWHPVSNAEQRCIAESLDTLDTQIRVIERAVQKQKWITAAVGQELIPVNPDPSFLGLGWELIPLSEIVPSADYGISASLASEGDGTPTLRMNNLADGRIRLHEVKVSAAPVPAHLILRDRDVLFNRTNSLEHVGRTSIWRNEIERATFASYLVRLNVDEGRLFPEYLVRWLNQPAIQQRIRRLATPGVHQVNINPTSLRRIEMELPTDMSRQRYISATLNACEDVTDRMKVELQSLRKIKQGLMDDLLTGRVRVKDVENTL